MLMKILSLFHSKYLSALTTLQARSNPMPRQPLNVSLFHVNWCTEIARAFAFFKDLCHVAPLKLCENETSLLLIKQIVSFFGNLFGAFLGFRLSEEKV